MKMDIIALERQASADASKTQKNRHEQFQKLLGELRVRELPDKLVATINDHIEDLNKFSGSSKAWGKLLKQVQTKIINSVEKEVKLVPKNHYRTTWMVIGMAAFGIPLGAAFGVSMGNMAFLGIGLPLGMGIGIAVGAAMDKKASDSGRQLDVELI